MSIHPTYEHPSLRIVPRETS